MTEQTQEAPKRIKLRLPKVKLFWKILIWFWLSIAILITINLFVRQIISERTDLWPIHPQAARELQNVEMEIIQLLTTTESRKQLTASNFINTYLINEEQEDYFNHKISDMLAELDFSVKRRNVLQSIRVRGQSYFGGVSLLIDGTSYRLYLKRSISRFNRAVIGNFFRETAQGLLLTIFIVGFPVSFLLTWLITNPIRKLQLTTEDIKKDLSNKDNLNKLLSRSDEFGELARDFDNMSNHVSKTLQSQKQLISDVSHELRSPISRLNIALGMAEKIDSGSLEKHHARIKLESKRMNDMLDNLLTMSKLDAQEFNTTKEKLDLCQLFKIVIDDGYFEAEDLKITILSELPSHCEFIGNKEWLLSGIENILRNAIKYVGQDGQIKCELKSLPDCILLSISDTGPGVELEQLDKLFDPFYRPDFDRARNSGGVGLGLAIAKRAFKINTGEVFAENIQPHGLKVSVKFTG